MTGVSLQLGQELQRVGMEQLENSRLDAVAYASVRKWKNDVSAVLPGMEFWEEEIEVKKWMGLVVEEASAGKNDTPYTLVLVEWRWDAESQELSCWKMHVTKDLSELIRFREEEASPVRSGKELEKWVGPGKKYCVMKQTGVRNFSWEEEQKGARLWVRMAQVQFSLGMQMSQRW